jgi:DNA-binding MarR family transcriptional regulator
MSSTTPAPTFGTPLLGQTEKALNAILDRQLAGSGVTEPQWVTLVIASGEAGDRDQLAGRLAGVLKVDEAEAKAQITKLVEAQMLQVPDGDRSPVQLTDAGRRLQGQVRAAVTPITQRLWGDLPAEDIETAGRVLGTVLARANAELASA